MQTFRITPLDDDVGFNIGPLGSFTPDETGGTSLTMNIYKGSTAMSSITLGSSNIQQVYVGSVLVWG